MVADFTYAGGPALGEAPESGERGTVAAMDEGPYKVIREFDDAMPEAATPQKAGVGLDMRLATMKRAYQWGEVAYFDRERSPDY